MGSVTQGSDLDGLEEVIIRASYITEFSYKVRIALDQSKSLLLLYEDEV